MKFPPSAETSCRSLPFVLASAPLPAAERYEPCRNPGAASTSMQSTEKAFYQAGETLSFSCQPGYELQGQGTIYCIPGHPSQWNSTPPACRGRVARLETHPLPFAAAAPTLIAAPSVFAATTAQFKNEHKLDGESAANPTLPSRCCSMQRKCKTGGTCRCRNPGSVAVDDVRRVG